MEEPFIQKNGVSLDMTAGQRRTRARIAAHTRWAKNDPVEYARQQQERFLQKFEREADPDGVLAPEERRRRGEQLRNAHMLRLAMKSAESRRRKAAQRRAG